MVAPQYLNLEGLPGPTHNFAGLAVGNLASERHRFEVSSPKRAALQSLAKMRTLHDLGVPLAICPPHQRPDKIAMRNLGFRGTDSAVMEKAHAAVPDLFRACYSSSAMWVANAATVSPPEDTADRRVHITPANLASQFHRALEPSFTAKLLKKIFPEGDFFTHHDPLLPCATLRDEGAANHLQLSLGPAKPGLRSLCGEMLPTLKADSLSGSPIAKGLSSGRKVTWFGARNSFPPTESRGHRSGVFHSDVISVSHGPLLLLHEHAFAEGPRALGRIQEAFPEVEIIQIGQDEISVEAAVSTYLFNSQLITLPNDSFALITPSNVEENANARACVEKIVANENRISKWMALPLGESMKNGGGPACLRLRVPVSAPSLAKFTRESCFLQRSKRFWRIGWSETIAKGSPSQNSSTPNYSWSLTRPWTS